MSEKQLDLKQLALQRPSAEAPPRRHRRAWITRYVVPGVILLGFAGLLLFAAGEQWLPRQKVTVVPVVVARAEVQQEGTPLFQAAGWIEPRPTPVIVPALTEGVVEELLVVEGQEVQAGEPVARLIDVDARLRLRQAKAELALREAELESVEAQLRAAQLRVEHPVHLEAALADAQSLLAQTETALAQLPYLIRSAEAKVQYARQNLEGKVAAGDAIAGRFLQQAHSDSAAAEAELDELKQRQPRLQAEAAALRRKVDALTTQHQLLIDESRELQEAQAKRRAAQARVDESQLAVEQVELALERTTVRTPMAGRVLALVAHPGVRVMGLESSANQNSSTVVTLYNPHMLQVRADVRLEEVPLVQPGQPVLIETASSKEPLTGTVLMPTSIANIQKNTLEVKVAINNPPPVIRPEMLVTATFLAPPAATLQEDESQQYERILVPRQLVQSDDGGQSTLWVVSADGTAQRQSIKLGKAGTEELVEVVDGIRPTDKLIASGSQGLQPGVRVTIAGEDPSIGRNNSRY